jgi:hypothetical protein
MHCGSSPIGELPAGTCDLDFTLGASNTGGGSGTLVPGPATARFVLMSGDGSVIYDDYTTPVTLVKAVTIDAVSINSTTLTIEGGHVSYIATVSNRTAATLNVTVVQAWIDQGGATRAAGGLQVNCGAGVGELPPGTCAVSFVVSASNGSSGSGTLVPGAATLRWELKNGNTDAVYDVFTMAVTLQ